MSLIVADFPRAIDFIHHLVHSPTRPVTILICNDRDHFLNQICTSVEDHQAHPGDPENDDTQIPAAGTESSSVRVHPLLSTTLRMIARSKHLKLIFCPRINVFRAYVVTQLAEQSAVPSQTPLLAILDMVALHHHTTEFSVQGLSRTFAALVECRIRYNLDMILNESVDAHEPENPSRGPRLWETQVPLLSGSVKLPGEGSNWAGRTISVKRVAGRWFEFKKISTVEDETMGI